MTYLLSSLKTTSRTDRPHSGGGGTAILIRRSIPFTQIFTPSSKNNKITEYTIARIGDDQYNLYFIAIYANNDEDQVFVDEINTLFDVLDLSAAGNYYVIAGDFNARHTAWGDSINKRKGVLLKRWEDETGLGFGAKIIPPAGPTFPSAGSYLDLCIIDGRIAITDLIDEKLRVADYSSDHKALTFTVMLPTPTMSCDPSSSYRFMFKRTKWKKFENQLARTYISAVPHDRNLSNEEITNHLLEIQSFINEGIDQLVPRFKPQDNVLNYVNRKIRSLRKDKSLLISTRNRLQLQGRNTPRARHQLVETQDLINKVDEQLRAEFGKSYTKYWNCQFKKIDHRKSQSFFPKINQFFRPKDQLKLDHLEVDRGDLNIINRAGIDISSTPGSPTTLEVSKPSDILNVLGAYFESINAPRYTNTGTEHRARVENQVVELISSFEENMRTRQSITTFCEENPATKPHQPDDGVFFTSIQGVRMIFMSLPNKTSAGLDGIPPIVLKHLPVTIVADYAILFNNCLNNRYFPDIWKQAKIFPILKKNKPNTQASSHRPISLTPAVSKAFEAVINKTIIHFAHKNEVIPSLQYGFTHQLSTTHAVHKVTDVINSHLHDGLTVGACLVDLEKAFDSVWIFGLLFILNQLGFPMDLIQLVWHMTSGRTFRLWDGENLSSIVFDILEGLSQGTVNSPILFNIYTHWITHVAFADDVIIIVADKSPAALQRKLESLTNQLNKKYREWNLRINPGKCETILFHKPLRMLGNKVRSEIKDFVIKIHQDGTHHEVGHKKSVKYLGVQLDYLLRLNQHILTQLTKAKNAFRANSRLFFNRSLTPRAKVICYLLLIRPLLTYASPIWWNTCAATMEKLRKFERSCLRACLHLYRIPETKRFFSNKTLYDKAKIPRIDCFITRLNRDYFSSLSRIDNIFLKECRTIDETLCIDRARTGYLHPHSFMYFDGLGCIQDVNNVPVLYHFPRHSANKTLDPERVVDVSGHKYAKTIPERDRRDTYMKGNRYWWLARDRQRRDEQRRRARRIRPVVRSSYVV